MANPKSYYARYEACLVLTVVFVNGAAQATPRCPRYSRADERAICRNQALHDQDMALRVTYEITLRFLGMGARDAERERQREWVAERGSCGSNIDCLTTQYKRRAAELQLILDRAYALGPL